MLDSPEVLFAVDGVVGRVSLNRPRALNALTPGMCAGIRRRLEEWAADDEIRVVVATGEGGRAFCAGGDVRRVWEAAREDPVRARGFFADEYAMDAAIADFPKPFVSLIDGIAMGGGLGISVNGRHRVVGEHATMAMPETGIGLLPDVGATAFLGACPGRIGLYLGLTGARVGAADALHAGLATHFVARDRQPALLAALAGGADVAAALGRFAGDPGPSALAARREAIDRLFAAGEAAEILDSLSRDDSEFAAEAAAALRRMSPTSLRITARQLTAHPGLSAKEALVLEYRMVCHVLERHDFLEGVRAALIDKDNDPRWRPDALDGVTDAEVDAHFAPLGDAELSLE